MQQEKVSTSARFITLTYAPKYMTREHGTITDNGFMGLYYRDVQLFFKRLRKAQVSYGKRRNVKVVPIRYYGVGEYGEEYYRPHYHVILFNAVEELIQPAWDLGQVHYGTVTYASIGYCLKYMCKPNRGRRFGRDDRPKEKAFMSKGIGKNYLTDAMVRWHKNDLENRMYVHYEGDKKCTMPRYFKDRLYSAEERLLIAARSIEKLNEQYQEDMKWNRGIFSPTYKIDTEREMENMYKKATQKKGGIF